MVTEIWGYRNNIPAGTLKIAVLVSSGIKLALAGFMLPLYEEKLLSFLDLSDKWMVVRHIYSGTAIWFDAPRTNLYIQRVFSPKYLVAGDAQKKL